MKRPKHLFLPILLSVFFFLICGCRPKPSVLTKDSPTFLAQDISELKGTNGKIVNQRLFKIKSSGEWLTDCYRIEYLSDRLRVVGFIIKPKRMDAKLPVILFNRGGGLELGKITEENLKYLSSLSSKGYVLLASQYRGNDGGEGREEFGGKDVNDVMNLIPLAKSLPFVKADRIGMLGFSRGGMMTYLAIKEGAPIKAAVVVGGLSDLTQFSQERGRNNLQHVIRNLVGPDIEAYKKRSAYDWPEKIDVPVLILHGGVDRVVDMSQARKLGEKLGELGKVYELVIFPEGDHGLNNLRDERDRKILEWFEKYLK